MTVYVHPCNDSHMNTNTAAKFAALAAIHFAKAAEGGERASYYLKLAQGEARRAAAAK